MLAPIEVSPETQELHERGRALAARLIDALQQQSEAVAIRAGEALSAYSGWLFIDEGFVKLMVRDRTVRYYEGGDLLHLDPARKEAQLESEFRLRGRLLSPNMLDRAVAHDVGVRQTVIDLLTCDARLMASLCAEHANVDRPPATRLTRVSPGEVILREGEHCEEVYMLVEGSAVVQCRGVVIGHIAPCEMAGEMSLLTGGACTATVIAETPCLLQAISKASMADTVRNRPETVLELAKTLAERLMRANQRQADQQADQQARRDDDVKRSG